jgi:hypothetical protein
MTLPLEKALLVNLLLLVGDILADKKLYEPKAWDFLLVN